LPGKEFGDVILGGMIYPTSEQTPDQVDHVYQIENTSTHVPLPSSSAAVLAKNTKLQATVKTRSSEATTSKTNSLSEVTPGGADSSGNIERKRVFFQRPGSACYDSFFTIAEENKKSGEEKQNVSVKCQPAVALR